MKDGKEGLYQANNTNNNEKEQTIDSYNESQHQGSSPFDDRHAKTDIESSLMNNPAGAKAFKSKRSKPKKNNKIKCTQDTGAPLRFPAKYTTI